MVVDYGRYAYLVCKLAFHVHGSQNLVCITVATFLHAHLLSLEKGGWGFLSEHRGFAVKVCHKHPMLSCRWIAGRSVLADVN